MSKANQTPEQKARDHIDAMLEQAGWFVQDKEKIDFSAGFGITVREYQADIGPADYVLFIDKNPIGVIEAKSATGVRRSRRSRSNPPVMLVLGSSGRTIESPCHLFMKVPACLRASPTCAIRNRAPGKCSASLGQRGYGIGSARRTRYELGSGGFRIWTPRASGRARSAPSKSWRHPSRMTTHAPSFRWRPAPARPMPPSLRSTGCSNTLTPSAFSFS